MGMWEQNNDGEGEDVDREISGGEILKYSIRRYTRCNEREAFKL